MNQAVYDFLKHIAQTKQVTTYGEVAPVAGLEPHSYELFRILGEISTYEHQNGRPLLSAVVL